jgi:hypothetical protein
MCAVVLSHARSHLAICGERMRSWTICLHLRESGDSKESRVEVK